MKVICFPQGTVATFYRWSGCIYNLLMWCFFRILPKITKIGSFFTELKKSRCHRFCECYSSLMQQNLFLFFLRRRRRRRADVRAQASQATNCMINN